MALPVPAVIDNNSHFFISEFVVRNPTPLNSEIIVCYRIIGPILAIQIPSVLDFNLLLSSIHDMYSE